MTVDELFAAAVAHHRAGRLSEAEAGYRRILAAVPDHVDSLHLLGVVAHQAGRSDIAVDLIGRAVRLYGAAAPLHVNLGEAFRALGRFDEAVASFGRALGLEPGNAEAHHNRGLALFQAGRNEEAIASIHRALALRPDHANAHNSLGATLRGLGRLDEAIASFRRAAAIQPGTAEFQNSLGAALQERGELTEAEACLRRALDLAPAHVAAHNNLGDVLRIRGRLDEGEIYLRRALEIDPACVEAHANLGLIAHLRDDGEAAVAHYRRALALDSAHGGANNNLATLLWKQGELVEAIEASERAVAARIVPPEALVQLPHLKAHACDWRRADADDRLLIDTARQGLGRVVPFPLLTAGSNAADQLNCARDYAASFAEVVSQGFSHGPARRQGKIRLGYLSADLRAHATTHLLADLIETHDRSRFEVVGYSIGPDDQSSSRRRIEAAFDRFVDLYPLDHAAAARRIHEDGIDILLDVMGYTTLSRTAILAARPAPIQVNYLAYAGTMGADFIDYMIADPVVLPAELEPFFSERIARLPVCYQPNDRKREIAPEAPSRADCGLPPEGFVFCCFNGPVKLRPAIFDRWMRILKAVPGSVLWLYAPDDLVVWNLRGEAVRRGVDPARLIFASPLPSADHLARHAQADLFLDTLPYNAHTTASDALWAGVPVLTCLGETFAGRVAASLLNAVGLPELVTRSLDDYEAAAIRIAREQGAIDGLKAKLKRNRATAPLFDTIRYACDIETAFERMVEIRRAGRPPESFSL